LTSSENRKTPKENGCQKGSNTRAGGQEAASRAEHNFPTGETT